MTKQQTAVVWFEELDAGDVPRVGGKNVSLGEMIRALKDEGVRVPNGFATTAEDLPEASFAGQQETFLNLSGEDDLLDACRRC